MRRRRESFSTPEPVALSVMTDAIETQPIQLDHGGDA